MERFPSKVDRWLIVVLCVAPAISIAAAVAVTVTTGPGALFAFITPIFVLGLYRLVVWPIHYDVTDSELTVRFGLFRRRIRISEIRRITPSHNPLSSPALSLDRIRIDYGGHAFILLSPADREGFATAIKRRVESVEIDEQLMPIRVRQTVR